mgnify:CR=1 FL=1
MQTHDSCILYVMAQILCLLIRFWDGCFRCRVCEGNTVDLYLSVLYNERKWIRWYAGAKHLFFVWCQLSYWHRVICVTRAMLVWEVPSNETMEIRLKRKKRKIIEKWIGRKAEYFPLVCIHGLEEKSRVGVVATLSLSWVYRRAYRRAQ